MFCHVTLITRIRGLHIRVHYATLSKIVLTKKKTPRNTHDEGKR